MYDTLLSIKKYREHTAEHAVLRQQRLVEENAQLLEQARIDAIQFHEYAQKEEIRLFEEIKGRPVSLCVLEDMKMHVALLNEQERATQKKVQDTEKQLQESEKVLEEAKQRHAKSVKEREKFCEFVSIWHEMQQRELDSREENELEEIASMNWHPEKMIHNEPD